MKVKRILTFLYTFFILVYFEITLRIFTIGTFDGRVIYSVLFCLPLAGVLFMLTCFSQKAIFKIIYNLLITVCAVFFCVQLVYYAVFGGFLSVALIGMGGDVFNNFFAQILNAMSESVAGLIFLLLPIIVTAVFTALKWLAFEKTDIRYTMVVASLAIVSHMFCLLALTYGGTGAYTVYDAYYSTGTGTNTLVKNMGVLVTARLEVQNQLKAKLGLAESTDGSAEINVDNIYEYWGKGDEYNVVDIDFDKLSKLMADNTTAMGVTAAISERTPTAKNEYTGMFEGYNLVTICAESFSPLIIDEELTPTLYKLSNEGFIFNNFYGSFESVTSDGEYSFCLGMYPDNGRTTGGTSFNVIRGHALPYALGNMFRSVGAETFAYHNNNGEFYVRNQTHPLMGYTFKSPDAGLDMVIQWPSSDLEMMMASIDDYASSGKQFHAYYMTFSGHYQYNWDNPMSAKHKDEVEHLNYSEEVKAYIACNLEVEYMLSCLMERLEEEGIAEKTVIVLTNDHYPYGLSEEQYNELAGYPVDTDFEKYRNSFICWSGSMDDPVEVNKLCSTVDILPTLLNLFGFKYDSRFIVGRDVLSDSESLAVLANESFITEKYKFNAVDNEIIMLTDEEISEEEIAETQQYVKDCMSISAGILGSDYYKYLVACLEENAS